MNKPLRLSKKTAKEIVRKVFGQSFGHLEKDEDGGDIYRMNIGELSVTVENDWFERNGLYVVNIAAHSHSVNHMQMYFRPDTLEEDTDAEEKWRTAK